MRGATLPTAERPLLSLTAADLMTAPVLTIPQETPLREAARLLCRSSISGAPVVDADGRCAGVLSSTDFVSWVEKGGEAGPGSEPTTFIAPWGEWINIEESADNAIRHYMTVRPVTVAPETPVGKLAQMMVDAHIHRLLVVDAADRPKGLVSSTDVLAAVARAAAAG